MNRGNSDHFDGERFFNPGLAGVRPLSAVPKMMRAPRAPWPQSVAVEQRRPEPHAADSWLTVTFVGHATFIVQTGAWTLLTDPMFSERASPLSFIGPRRVRRPGVRIADLPPIDVVLLSHNHYDHCDRPSLRSIARRFDPLVVTPLGNARFVRTCGFTRVEEVDWWEAAQRAPLPVTLGPAQHFSARTPFDRNRALWGSFMLDIGDRRLFFAGDTGYGPHFTEVRRRMGAPDLAFLPIGAYEPRWFMRDIHMNPEEAVQAHLDLEARQSVGMHFGTFRLTAEGIDEPLRALERARRERGVTDDAFSTLGFGESVHLRR
jgi:L-ascorbate metabolism protein UlaG (beta-lactamase superfamily)